MAVVIRAEWARHCDRLAAGGSNSHDLDALAGCSRSLPQRDPAHPARGCTRRGQVRRNREQIFTLAARHHGAGAAIVRGPRWCQPVPAATTACTAGWARVVATAAGSFRGPPGAGRPRSGRQRGRAQGPEPGPGRGPPVVPASGAGASGRPGWSLAWPGRPRRSPDPDRARYLAGPPRRKWSAVMCATPPRRGHSRRGHGRRAWLRRGRRRLPGLGGPGRAAPRWRHVGRGVGVPPPPATLSACSAAEDMLRAGASPGPSCAPPPSWRPGPRS